MSFSFPHAIATTRQFSSSSFHGFPLNLYSFSFDFIFFFRFIFFPAALLFFMPALFLPRRPFDFAVASDDLRVPYFPRFAAQFSTPFSVLNIFAQDFAVFRHARRCLLQRFTA